MSRLLLSVAVLAVGGLALAQEKIVQPKELVAPRYVGALGSVQALTVQVEGEELTFTRTLTRYVPQQVVEKVVRDGKEVEVTRTVFVPVAVMESTRIKLDGLKAFTTDGKPVALADLKKRLAKPTAILAVPTEGQAQDAALRGLLKDDVLLVVTGPLDSPMPMPKQALPRPLDR